MTFQTENQPKFCRHVFFPPNRVTFPSYLNLNNAANVRPIRQLRAI